MIKKAADLSTSVVTGLRGGEGEIVKTVLGEAAESFGHVSLFANFTLRPGSSIGYHTHDTNAEYYYVLSGTLELNEDGAVSVLHPGDVSLCRDGKGHSVKNIGDTDAVMVAMIAEE